MRESIEAYSGGVPISCEASFMDGAGLTHTSTKPPHLGVHGIPPLRRAVATVGTATRLKVAVEPPVTTHELSVAMPHWRPLIIEGNQTVYSEPERC